MHMFFAAVMKRGRELRQSERERIARCVREHVMFPELSRVFETSPTPSSVVVAASNEPTGGWWETPHRQIFLSGYCNDPEVVERASVDLDLSLSISRASGRFSALVVDRQRQRFALATPPARVDSIFRAENDDCIYFGNQASLLSILREGHLSFAPERLMTLLDAGFFGNDATPYAGVDVLGPCTTVLCDGARVERRQLGLWTFKEPRRPSLHRAITRRVNPLSGLGDEAENLAEHLTRAFSPLLSQGKIQLGLTGGMDSRLLLVSALAAGVRVETFTNRYGEANQADVALAEHIARAVGVKHRIQERTHPNRTMDAETPPDVLAHTKRTLKATDGTLSVRYPVADIKAQSRSLHVSGQGGEVLRGGWGEKEWRPPAVVLGARFSHFKKLFLPEVVEQHQRELTQRLASYPSHLASGDVLDCAYVDLRCGRWAAAATSASTSRIRPLLDNAVVDLALTLPANVKRLHVLHKRLIEILCPALADVPLANKHWHGTGPVTRHLIARRWPQAFRETRSQSKAKARTLQPNNEALIKRYVIEEDRLALLEKLVNRDRTRRYVAQGPRNAQAYAHLLLGLFSVCVLLAENWRQGP